MKFTIVTIFLLFAALHTFAQKAEVDTLIVPDFELKERKMFYDQLFDFSDNSIYGGLIENKADFFKQPLISDTNWKIDFNSIQNPFSIPTDNSSFSFGFNPFFNSFSITNQARYQISDKFTVGGNSFVGNSVFSPSLMNKYSDNWDIKGASMFMEYKVSKKFKIETRFTVTNQSSDFPLP